MNPLKTWRDVHVEPRVYFSSQTTGLLFMSNHGFTSLKNTPNITLSFLIILLWVQSSRTIPSRRYYPCHPCKLLILMSTFTFFHWFSFIGVNTSYRKYKPNL